MDFEILPSGDGFKWLIAPTISAIGEEYSNDPREVFASSLESDPHTAQWYNRKNYNEDPWISLLNHDGGSDYMVYGEASDTDHIKSVRDNNGANVYVRFKG